MPRLVRSALPVLVVAAIGCGGPEGTPAPNIEPDTFITGSVPADSGSVVNHVEIFWSGGDIDGTIVAYQYFVQTYARFVASIDEIVVLEPASSDPGWIDFDRTDIVLVLPADTLRADPRGDIGEGLFDRWHTFWVRAIDDAGAVDPFPPHVTFRAFTKAPRMWLNGPVLRDELARVPPTFVMNWWGADDIGNGTLQDPRQTRWLLRTVQLDGMNQPIGYPDALYDLTDDDWTDWADLNAADSSGVEAVFFDQLPVGAVDTPFLFAIQGRDDGGAITPQFDSETPLGNNYGVFIVSDSLPVGPRFTVSSDDPGLPQWVFDGDDAVPFDVSTAQDTVRISWSAMETFHYGANPGQYRFGWGITNPSNDDQWTPWSSIVRQSPPQPLVQPVEEIRIQARDHIGLITTAVIRFNQ